MKGFRSWALLSACCALGAAAASAQDPPARVARLNLINGQVSFQPASLDTWTAASLNYPLTTGDHLYTDAGSRAEMHIAPNAIRLGQQTNFGFLNLDDRTVQMRFTEGSMEMRVRALGDQDVYEIDTPQGAISLLRPGEYRIDTDPQRNATMVTVRAGEVEVTANGSAFPVHPGQTAYFAEGAPPDVRAENPPDDFDRFTADRNAREDRIPPPRQVPATMIGYEDLYAYGVWREVPNYGWCWAPPVQAGWAPYRFGHWAWVEPWGWTWIDNAPWGFAPFHYGRWAVVGGGWMWVPGAVAVRPVYAPALVAFVGGPHFGVGAGGGVGIGAVAWFPLGPQEVFRPAYAVSPTYVRNVNVTNVTNVTNITNVNVTNVRYANQNVQGAVTAVPQNAFVSARPVNQVAQPVTSQQLAQAQVVEHPGVTPRRESVLGASPASTVPQPPASVMTRQVVAKSTPPPPPVSFQAREAMLAQNQGRPLAPQQVAQLRQQQPGAVVNRSPVRPAGAFAAAPAPNRVTPQNIPPVNRLDSRPPTARPLPATNAQQPQTTSPEFNRAAPREQQIVRPSAPASSPATRPNAATPPTPNRTERIDRTPPKKEPPKKEERKEERKGERQ